MSGPMLFDLTPLTGRNASVDRTVVILSYDVNYILARVAVLSLIPSGLAGLIFLPFIGSYMILIIFFVELVLVCIFYLRSSSGLQLRVWRQFWNRSRANNGKIFLRGRPMTTDQTRLLTITHASMPNPCLRNYTDDDVFGSTRQPIVDETPLEPAPARLAIPLDHTWYQEVPSRW